MSNCPMTKHGRFTHSVKRVRTMRFLIKVSQPPMPKQAIGPQPYTGIDRVQRKNPIARSESSGVFLFRNSSSRLNDFRRARLCW